MGIVARQSGEVREPVPAGNYFGVCVGVYDLGTQPGGQYGPRHQVVLQFELHKKKGVCRNKEGKPLTISNFYSLSFGEKANLRIDVQKILGRSFTDEEAKQGYDVTQLIDRACRLTIEHSKKEDGSTRDQIGAFMPLDEDDPKVTPETDGIVYELNVGEDVSSAVPEWIRKRIEQSAEWVKAHGKTSGKSVGGGKRQTVPADDEDDDVIF